MKKIFFLFISFCAGVMQAQDYEIIDNHTVFSTELYDFVEHEIQTGHEGPTFRFLHPVFGEDLWTLNSLVDRIITDYDLSSSSSQFEIVFAAISFIKKSGVEKHVQGYGYGLPHDINALQSQDGFSDGSLKHSMSFNSFTSKLCGEFNHKAHFLVGQITNTLLLDEIIIRGVSLPGHQTNEYWDDELSQWVYFDPDPQSEVFIPRHNHQLVSVADLVLDNSILKDTTSFFHSRMYGQEDSMSIFYSINNTRRYLEDINEISFYEFSDIEIDAYPHDTYYKLLPNQKIIWEYDISSVYLEKYMFSNECSRDLFLGLGEFFSDESIWSTMNEEEIIEIALGFTGAIARCYDVDSMMLSYTILGERISFKDSTYYGINNRQEQFFSTTIPAGTYTTNELYIPNIIRSVSGGSILFEDSKELQDGFFWVSPTWEEIDPEDNPEPERTGALQTLTQNFTVDSEVTVTFLGNYDIHLVPEIALFEGTLTSKTKVNGKEINSYITQITNPSKETYSLTIHPNPTTGTIYLSEESSGEIYDLMGKRVATFNNTSEVQLPPQNGMYFINTRNGSMNKVIKH